jgi:hypothetical protein
MPRREIKIVATDEQPLVVAIPDVVGIVIVAVEPTVVVVVFNVEHVQIAIGIRIVPDIIHYHHSLIH